MTVRIKLTEDDIEIVYFERYILHIEKTKSKEQAEQLRQQILENQKIVERLERKLDTMNKRGEMDLSWVHDVFTKVLTGDHPK
ncbi:hypothetical protein IID24_05770 [Patescibacteria group bacterium]|nr:hypothetical protein [Patescibacteria group bacterium]